MGTPEMPTLWVGGEYKRTTVYDCESYREWLVFTPTEVEGFIKASNLGNELLTESYPPSLDISQSVY